MPGPLIGLTAATQGDGISSEATVRIRRQYIRAVLDSGGLPVVIPPGPEHVLRATLARLDGLLLPGGGDIEPIRFGEAPHPALGQVQPELDDLELTLCRWALAEGKPILGICRGIQVMNVAAGGTLYQDIPSQYRTDINHSPERTLPRGYIAHEIVVDTRSRLAHLVGDRPLPVNSWHHQAIMSLGRGLVVSAHAPDGIIEGVELPDHPFAIGVQFHPEDLYQAHERVRWLLVGFIEACRSSGEDRAA